MGNDWEKFGKDIRNIVEDAVNSQDFRQLNKTITNTVNEAVSSIQKGIKSAGQAVSDAANQAAEDVKDRNESSFWSPYQYNQKSRNRQKQESSIVSQGEYINTDLYKKNTSVKAGGWTLMICGYTFNALFLLAIVILILVSMFLGGFNIGIKIALSILTPFFLGSAFMAWKGSSMISSLKRYHGYIKELNGRTYCNIKELAERNGKSFQYVLKDVKKMIHKGWFREGHLDNDNTCLIVSHDTYREYQNLQKQKMEQQLSDLSRQERKKDNPEINEEVKKVIEEGKEYIKRIRECNDAIPGEDISQKISHMEMLVQKIFDRVKEDPDSLDDIRKLMEYYLPTTVKLLESYKQLDCQPVQGENIKSSKEEIEKTLDTLNTAFERLLDSLFEDVAWDVSSDISVLNTMLSQEGLTGDSIMKNTK